MTIVALINLGVFVVLCVVGLAWIKLQAAIEADKED